MHFIIVAFLPKLQPQHNCEKNLRQTHIEEHSTMYLTSTPQNCQGHHKQGKSEKLSQSGGDMMTKYNVLGRILEQKKANG